MSVVVPKTDARRFEEPPLSWHPAWAKDHPIAIFTCPGGSTGSLHGWTVADDGTVTPSVDCRCGCGFHEFIQLEDWNPDWLPRRADSQPEMRSGEAGTVTRPAGSEEPTT